VISTIDGLMGVSDGYRCYDTNVQDFFNVTKNDETQCYASSGIGDGSYLYLNNHVNGISSLARLGKSIPQSFILQVINNEGKTIKQWTQPAGTQVVKADSAYIVDNMASDPNASYLSGNCNASTCYGEKFHRYKGWDTAIKTGTTNYNFDGLMMAWNTQFTAGIWVGNHTRNVPFNTAPENITDPIMKQFMQGALDTLGNTKPANWTQPNDIKVESAYVNTHRYLGQVVPSNGTDIFPSWYAGGKGGTSKTIDKVSGLLATSCTPAGARQSNGDGSLATWNVDLFMNGTPNVGGASTANTDTTQQSDNIHSCSDSPPTATITAVNGLPVSGGTTLQCPSTGCTIMVHVEQGTHALNDPSYPNYPGTLSLVVNGQSVQSQPVNSSGDYQLTFTPPAGTSGSVQITAQVTDSVLYQGSDTQTITIPTTTTGFRMQTNSGGAGRGGRGNNTLASYIRKYASNAQN
jgi:hypothetical protein